MLLFMLAALQATEPPRGGMTLRREQDPSAICMVTAAIESGKTKTPVTQFDRRPKVRREAPLAVVTYKKARTRDGRAVEVTCQVNFDTRQVTSVTVAGDEILSTPQVF